MSTFEILTVVFVMTTHVAGFVAFAAKNTAAMKAEKTRKAKSRLTRAVRRLESLENQDLALAQEILAATSEATIGYLSMVKADLQDEIEKAYRDVIRFADASK